MLYARTFGKLYMITSYSYYQIEQLTNEFFTDSNLLVSQTLPVCFFYNLGCKYGLTVQNSLLFKVSA